MTISPEEITGRTFQLRFRGVNPDEVKEHLEMLAGEFAALQKRFAELEQTAGDQKKELERAADDQKGFEDVTAVFKDNIEKLKSEIRVKEQNGSELLRELERMKRQVQDLAVERDGLKHELSGKATQLSELESKYRMSRAAVDELRRKQAQFETERREMTERTGEREQELADLRVKYTALAEQSRTDSSRLVEAAQEEIERMRSQASLEMVQLKDDVETLAARRIQIQDELRDLLTGHLQRLDAFASGERERSQERYGELFQKIDFTELEEFEDDSAAGESPAAPDGPELSEDDEQLKSRLEDGGIAYLSGE